ncbi:serpentine type 7TM GPCR chemoreceptor srsx domain-containing protein [Ditylenchus destructor]|nr:serpentine type 7TM GPCR chemoreceptor srsx domain-containing protein [Ditylenchus destructor]
MASDPVEEITLDFSQPYNLPTIVVALFILRAFVGLIGIIFNLDLVYIICANRSLHSSCSLLLALKAFCDALYEFSFITNAGIAAGLTPGTGAQVIRLQTCFFIQIVPTFGANSSIMLTLAIGLDRLLHAVFPIFFYHRTESRSILYYSMVLAGFCFGYGFYIVYGSIKAVFTSPVENYVICGIHDLYVGNLAYDMLLCVGGSLAIIMALASFSCGPLLYTFSREYRRAFQRQFWAIGRCIGLNASYFAASKDNSHVIFNVRMSPLVMMNHSELRSSSQNGNQNH